MAKLGINRIPDEIEEELARFVKLPLELIEQVVAKSAAAQPASGIPTFVTRIAKELGAEKDDVGQILTTLKNLKQVSEYSELAPDKLLKVIRSVLAARDWDDERLAAFDERQPVVQRELGGLSADSALMLSAKTSALAYARQYILHRTQILTDLRPVFDESGQDIKDMILTHSLVVFYSDGINHPQELHITMDWRDVSQLRENCDRADLKAERIIKLMEKNPWPTINYPGTSEE